jgi:hypothetical protein
LAAADSTLAPSREWRALADLRMLDAPPARAWDSLLSASVPPSGSAVPGSAGGLLGDAEGAGLGSRLAKSAARPVLLRCCPLSGLVGTLATGTWVARKAGF